ncbi:GNAT family N-acetyltransferase [Aureibaculum sp. A20]|uniref:GNAT family N-acetyltransferase n=1 Tax=Aureibaculum flavum TaxID=2795986 RepID=A0ABS0WTG2_9FLAO|nr:GNAT family N-acetyltransferase [Aureibaculum flavum]MBJ2175269.1 GNAT family N-acetyltransferase [Aureibaculum flavum]
MTIFKTKRLQVRRLIMEDFKAFNKMQSNKNVMKYVRGRPMTYEENKEELPKLIDVYDKEGNDFYIYAITRSEDGVFIGTVALVKDEHNKDEIGYRFLEEYWGSGYGTEVLSGLIAYCKSIKIKNIIAVVATENIASLKMIKNVGFQFIEKFVSDDLKIPEQRYVLSLLKLQCKK